MTSAEVIHSHLINHDELLIHLRDEPTFHSMLTLPPVTLVDLNIHRYLLFYIIRYYLIINQWSKMNCIGEELQHHKFISLASWNR